MIDSILQERSTGSVYLLQSENGYYKIGIAKNIESRLVGVRSRFPIRIDLVHSIKSRDYRQVENFLHRKFLDKRAEREWFKLDPGDVRWFMSLRDYELDNSLGGWIPALPREKKPRR